MNFVLFFFLHSTSDIALVHILFSLLSLLDGVPEF